MHLKNLSTGPPGNWRFTQKETGFTMAAITFGSLLGKVSQHRVNLNLPEVSDGYNSLADEVEDFICKSLSPADQVNNCEMGFHAPTSIHWKKVLQFLKTMADWFLVHGLQRVPQEEAERRAAICAKCPLNVGLAGCGICRATLEGIRSSLFKASTSHDSELRACGVCGCDNKLSVHVPLDSLKSTERPGLQFPEWCWKTKDAA